MDVSQYMDMFIEESREHLQNLNTTLLEMETTPDNKELINEVFRVAHTLKGMAGTMGFKKMNVLTHNMENVLSEIRNDVITVSPSLLDTLFQCLDALEGYVDTITTTGTEGDKDYPEIVHSLSAILENKGQIEAESPTQPSNLEVSAKSEPVTEKPSEVELSKTNIKTDSKGELSPEEANKRKHLMLPLTEFEESAIQEGTKEGYKAVGLTIFIADSCVLKSARAFIIFNTLESLGQVIKANPSVQDIEDEKFETDFSVFLATKKPVEQIVEAITGIVEVEMVYGDIIEVEASQQSQGQGSKQEVEVTDKRNDKKEDNNRKNTKQKTNRTVRVDIERLDNLMNLVSELIIVKNGLETVENINQNMNEQIEYLERITTNLHDAVMKVRMVPIERVFNRFPRLIRDLSRSLDKNMVLHMTGEETELDRTVIDEIGDPLVHLIRNAGDHGMETPQERKAAGKPEQGNIYLDAYQDGNNVVIEVAEDGRGIDVEKVKEKAISKGTISPEQAEAMNDKDVIDLLFRPSFSTADKISDVSGRGVGLDVVKTKIESLGGDIEVKSKFGKGSKFIIRLPLTLAIIQALMVKMGNEKYAIPLNSIRNIEDVKVSDIKYVQSQKVINLRNSVIPIVDLSGMLGVPVEETEQESVTVVIVTKGEKLAGFRVDGLIGQQEIVIKSLGKYLRNNKLIAGATILGDGEVALILDVNTLL